MSAVDHVLGPEHAPVTVVEYADFECPNCKQAAPAVKLLLERFAAAGSNRVPAQPARGSAPARADRGGGGECAGAQGQFWPMHDLLFENQLHLKTQQLHGYAERLRLEMARYTAEMDDHVYLQRIREHQRSGRDSGVRGTPTFFVNGSIQDVSFGIHALFDAVEALLKSSP